MHTFLITLQRRWGEGWPIVTEYNRSGEVLPVRSEGVLQFIPDELKNVEYDLRAYGTALGSALFRDDIRDAFSAARRESEDRLHVMLFIEADELKGLRWERLCAPLDGSWDFLSLNRRVPYSRYLPSRFYRRYPPIGRTDLRALILAANPSDLQVYGLTPFDVRAAVDGVRESLASIPTDTLAFTNDAVGNPTLDELCDRITSGSYTLLHLICHGIHIRERGETVLFLSDKNNEADKVTSTRLLERLSRLYGASGLPQVFFLASCESAAPSAEKGLGGLAQRLVRDLGTPAVIAMTDQISIATANALSAAFYRRLVEHGEVDLALVEAGAALASRFDVTVPALYSRLGGRPIFSDLLEHPLSDAEIANGINRILEALSERAPVMEPDFAVEAAKLKKLLSTGSEALSADKQSDFNAGLGEVEVLSNQVLDINFRALAKGKPLPDYDSRCPFRGLYPFRTEDLEFFYGREALVEQLLERLDEYPFLAILGPSGSGKSSLVLAGVLPALINRRPELVTAYLTPGSDPLAQLEASLSQVNGDPNVLIVDQFEELFTLVSDEQQRKDFLGRLLPLSDCCPVILTMRADFWGECAPYPDLKSAMQAHQELIAPMDAAELRRAMELQAAAVKLRFESGLGASILDDVIEGPGAMPLLQHALQELWKRRHGRWLRSDEYQAIGGIKQAIAHTADRVYDGLPEDLQDQVRGIFMRLTRLDEEVGLGGEMRDTRRRVTLDEISPSVDELRQTRILVKELADARLVVTSLNAVTGQEEVEVAHEALIRAWPRLRGWLQEDRQMLLLRDQLRREAVQWEQRDKDASYLLLFGARLDEFQDLEVHPRVKLNDLERRYLAACRENEQKRYSEAAAAGQDFIADIDMLMDFPTPDADADFSTINIYIGPHARQATISRTGISTEAKFSLDLNALRSLENDSISYMQLLSKSFFADPEVREIFLKARHSLVDVKHLKVRFWIDPSVTDLHTISWETLQDPRDGKPLLLREDIWISRAVDTPEVKVRSRRALRALIMTPNPANITDYDLPAVDIDSELQLARNGLGTISSSVLPDLATHARATLNNLFAALDKSSPQILYLTCFIRVVDGDARLFLEDEQGELQIVSSQELVQRVRDLSQRPWLVVLKPPQSAIGISSDGMLALAPRLVHAGVFAVLALHGRKFESPIETLTTSFFQELQRDGQVERATAIARNSVSPSGVWRSTLYTSLDDGRLWYIPGFSSKDIEKWPAIFRSIERGQVTPILGPGLVEPLLGSRDEMARRWAYTYNFPGASAQSVRISQVAQYLSVSQYDRFPHDVLADTLKKHIKFKYGSNLPSDLINGDTDLDAMIKAAWNSVWSQNTTDPHHLLAQLPLSVYLTTNADNLLSLALEDAGREPEVVLCPWNEYVERLESIYVREPDYSPTPERPLVYHFFGRYNEMESLVLTEDDSIEFAIRSGNKNLWPPEVPRALTVSALLYLGHQYEDSNFKTLLKTLTMIPGGMLRRRFLHIMQIEPEAGKQGERKRRYQEQSLRIGYDISVYWGEVQDIVSVIQARWNE